jgi:hypothetical protein
MNGYHLLNMPDLLCSYTTGVRALYTNLVCVVVLYDVYTQGSRNKVLSQQ